jgi:hypothetical protein
MDCGCASAAMRSSRPRGSPPRSPANLCGAPRGGWLLLSSVPTRTREEALERLAWYARRWTIESWHRVLKSGCRVEARQFANLDRFVCATALFAVIGWRIMYATLLARLERDLPRACCCSRSCRAHNTTRLPAQPPSLAQAVLWTARPGGYLNRRHDRPPGPTVMWRGFLALHEITQMYRVFRQDG